MWPRLICTLLLGLLGASSAWALDPSERLSQYGHTSWSSRDGYFGGGFPVRIAQTQDGYLWIAASTGLFRFDGVRFVAWSPPDGKPLPLPSSLLAARDGGLWIGALGYLIHWHSGQLTRYAVGPFWVRAMLEARDGALWFVLGFRGHEKPGKLCRLERNQPLCYGASDGFEGLSPQTLAEDAAGNLWIGDDLSVARWAPGSRERYEVPALRSKGGFGVSSLALAPDGSAWVGIIYPGVHLGLEHLVAGQMRPVVTAQLDGSTLAVSSLHLDEKGSLWVGTANQGLYRITGEAVDHLSGDGLSGNYVEALLEDREGTLWVATVGGLDAFRQLQVVTVSNREGLSVTNVETVHATSEGTVWVGGAQGLDAIRGTGVTSIRVPGSPVTRILRDHTGTLWVGVKNALTLLKNDRFDAIPLPDSDAKDLVQSLTEDVSGNIWAEIRGQPAKLIRIHDQRVQEVFPEPRVPPASELAPDRDGGIWMGLTSGDLAHFQNGDLEVFPFEHKDEAPYIIQIASRSDGSVLAAATFGLMGWNHGTRRLMTVRNGLPCDFVSGVVEDNHGTIWLATPCALLGIAPEEIGEWWRDPNVRVHPRILNSLDGWQSRFVAFQPTTRSTDGRLWFANQRGVQIFDPEHPIHNTVPPPVYIEGLVADRRALSLDGGLSLPPYTRDVQFNYTALSMVVPQEVRFRYRLEGHDSDWQDVGSRREAFYNDLPPGNYRFRVIASNNDGVWNEAGDSVSFSIAPAWNQTNLARAVCLVLGIVIFWLIYRTRARQIEATIWSRFNERLAERTRVARDIHDTLLQTIQGSKMVADHAVEHASDTTRLRTAMEQLADWLARATQEGRAALASLRADTTDGYRLLEALKRAAQTEAGSSSLAVTIVSSGEPREVHPIVSDELYRIACEAMRNVRMHSSARNMTLELVYGPRLILRVIDDGIGMDTAALEQGRPGHFGLLGMRERAARIGGKLTITSAPGAGTVLTLVVPGGLAFQRDQPGIFGKLRVFRHTTFGTGRHQTKREP